MMDVDIVRVPDTSKQTTPDDNLMLNMDFFDDLITVKDELFSGFDSSSPIGDIDSLLSDFDQCMTPGQMNLDSCGESSSRGPVDPGTSSSGSCYASSSCSSSDLLHSDNEEYFSGGECELDTSTGVEASPLSAVSSDTLQTANAAPPISHTASVQDSDRKPLVVPVSVRGAGTVCTVRILPASASPAALSSTADATQKPSVVHVKNVQNLRATAPAARVIRVVRKQQQHSHTTLPVISVTSGNSSSLSRLQWPRAPQAHGASRVSLSGEERRLFEQEGLHIPTSWPLTRQQEYDLKRIRRKIRNKMSAQDSRKRKKQYYDSLEERVRVCTDENRSLHKRLRALETKSDALAVENETLTAQLRRATTRSTNPSQPVACLILLLLLSVSLCILPGQRAKQNTPNHSFYTESGSSLVSTAPSLRPASAPVNFLRQLMTGVLTSPQIVPVNKPSIVSPTPTVPLHLGVAGMEMGVSGLCDGRAGNLCSGVDSNKLLLQLD